MANDLSKIGIVGIIRPTRTSNDLAKAGWTAALRLPNANIAVKMGMVAVLRTSGRHEITKMGMVAVLRPGAVTTPARRRALFVS